MSSRPRVLRVLLVALSVGWGLPVCNAMAQSKPAPCVATSAGAALCGSGGGALRVIDGTTSPSGTLAVAWGAPDHDPTEVPDGDSVENHLVRLADGRALTLTVGRFWQTDKQRANHVYQRVAWSPDSRWLVVADSSKWTLEAIAVYSISADHERARTLGLLRTISAAARKQLVALKGGARASRYVMDIADTRGMSVTNSGFISIPVAFNVPKSDDLIRLDVRLRAEAQSDQVRVQVISILPVARER